MGISDVVSLLGALSVFLFGMSTMTSGLEKLASGRLAALLEKLTDNILKGVLLGAVVAGMVHSSAATTVMCIGFVNAGILKLRQAVGVIMGANIGTTITAQILRLGDLSSDNLFVSLLRPEMLGPIMAFAGIILYSFITGGRKKTAGQVLLGLGLLFIGIKSMETALLPLTGLESFRMFFVRFSNPILGILAGALITALIQSSTASVGILQALAANGMVTFATAMPIIMGQNIGTCITAVISSIGATRNAKRTAAVHLYFNLLGTLFFLVLLYGLNAVVGLGFWDSLMSRGDIANLHSVFNISCTMLLLPFNRLLVKLVELTIPDRDAADLTSTVLDSRFLSTPSVALERARTVVTQMSELAMVDYKLALELMKNYDEKAQAQLDENETRLDHMEAMLNNYLIQLSRHSLASRESDRVSDLLYSLSDFERIGDYAVNIAETAAAMKEQGLEFSGFSMSQLDRLTVLVGKTLETTVEACRENSSEVAFNVEPLEEVVDIMVAYIHESQIEHLKSGNCPANAYAYYSELLIYIERISDHCSNAAMRLIRQNSNSDSLIHKDPHAYMHDMHEGKSPEFNALFNENKKKYLNGLGIENTARAAQVQE